jgi:ATP-dependent Clp protease protease subunit
MLNQILCDHTGQKIAKVAKDTERDFFMSAGESKEYGLVDHVLTKTTGK